ncbi:hypothetical protein DL96DRAFT_599979 [Flagelloscypha sp. PMI_526]|nr:hypothetical protein DL96DRAFT_599979 [Flagelloscypha sp. PMI_526]
MSSSYDPEEYYTLFYSLSKLRDEANSRISDIRAKADRKVATVEAHVHQEQIRLGRKVNSASRTCQLPVDILTSIFEHVSRSCMPDPLEYWTSPRREYATGDVGWYKCILHCCSYWRKLALNTPNLWTTIVLTGTNSSLQRTEFHLRQSQRRNLDIRISHSPYARAPVEELESVLKHLDRFRAFYLLKIDPRMYGHAAWFDTLLQNPHPALLYLAIPNPPLRSSHMFAEIADQALRTSSFLKSLVLYSLPSSSPNQSNNITHFHISDCTSSYSIHDAINFIAQLRKLEEVWIELPYHFQESSYPPLASPSKPCQLKYLERVRLRGLLLPCETLLSCFLPSSLSSGRNPLVVEIDAYNHVGGSYPALYAAIKEFISPAKITSKLETNIQLALSQTSLATLHSTNKELALSVSCPLEDAAVAAILPLISSQNVQTFTIRGVLKLPGVIPSANELRLSGSQEDLLPAFILPSFLEAMPSISTLQFQHMIPHSNYVYVLENLSSMELWSSQLQEVHLSEFAVFRGQIPRLARLFAKDVHPSSSSPRIYFHSMRFQAKKMNSVKRLFPTGEVAIAPQLSFSI